LYLIDFKRFLKIRKGDFLRLFNLLLTFSQKFEGILNGKFAGVTVPHYGAC